MVGYENGLWPVGLAVAVSWEKGSYGDGKGAVSKKLQVEADKGLAPAWIG